jgi:hypothetical protein
MEVFKYPRYYPRNAGLHVLQRSFAYPFPSAAAFEKGRLRHFLSIMILIGRKGED